jgi:hypothetical protein
MSSKQLEEAAGFLSDATRKRYLKRGLNEGRIEQPMRGWYQPKDFIPFDQSQIAA